MKGYICKGVSIKSWADGSNAKYGNTKGMSNCEAICDSHIECGGFTHRPSEDVCFWKQEPLTSFTSAYIARNNNCHKKVKGNTIVYLQVYA